MKKIISILITVVPVMMSAHALNEGSVAASQNLMRRLYPEDFSAVVSYAQNKASYGLVNVNQATQQIVKTIQETAPKTNVAGLPSKMALRNKVIGFCTGIGAGAYALYNKITSKMKTNSVEPTYIKKVQNILQESKSYITTHPKTAIIAGLGIVGVGIGLPVVTKYVGVKDKKSLQSNCTKTAEVKQKNTLPVKQATLR